jgi:hypothetical protein
MSTEAFYSALRGLAIAIAQFWLGWLVIAVLVATKAAGMW